MTDRTARCSAVLLRSAVSLAALAAMQAPSAAESQPACDPDNGGLRLPSGLCALVVADDVGRARHLVVTSRGDLYVALRGGRGSGAGILAMRDTTGDGRADVRELFGEAGGTGIALVGNELYFGRNDAVVRYRLPTDGLVPVGRPEVVVSGLPAEGSHASKSIALDPAGALFVNIGSPSNACQVRDRSPGSPGADPCPELQRRAGVWRFELDRLGQTQADGERWATGLRNTVALAVDPASGALFGVVHGRDQLHQHWSHLYSERDGAEKPSEEFHRIDRGGVYSWPYCFHDGDLGRLVLAPEYGGDGSTAGRCTDLREPLVGFPAHWAPNALLFYHGEALGDRYRGGAFIAFHGSWNRAPLPQQGYNVVFVPFEGGRPAGDWEVFADGFAGENVGPRSADHRPSGLASGPDGSVYVSDDQGGRIWRILAR